MLISVVYPDGKHDLVKGFYLTYLINMREISKFKRADGWIDIDSDKVRGRGQKQSYQGPERRSSTQEVTVAAS